MSIPFRISAALFLFVLIAAGCRKTSAGGVQINTDSTGSVVTDNDFYSITISDSIQPSAQILLALSSSSTGKVIMLDQRGSVIMEKESSPHVENFQKWTIHGQTRYTYFQTQADYLLDGLTGTELGYQEICDSGLNILSTTKLLSYGTIDNTVQDKMDTHEFILLDDNHYITETYYEKTPDNIPDSLHPAPGVKVAACIIQEVNNGQVVFQWDGSQYPEFYSASLENNNFSDATTIHDYMHLNSICVDSTDNNLIVSFRNLDEIVKLNRQTGQIMWRLGGNQSDFPLAPDEVFLRQHYPRLIENGKTLILVDNGLDSVRPYTRILEFQLNETDRTISSFKSFRIPDLFIQFAGSVEKEGEHYFIGGGSANYALEVNYNTNQPLFRLSLKYPSYRALKY